MLDYYVWKAISPQMFDKLLGKCRPRCCKIGGRRGSKNRGFQNLSEERDFCTRTRSRRRARCSRSVDLSEFSCVTEVHRSFQQLFQGIRDHPPATQLSAIYFSFLDGLIKTKLEGRVRKTVLLWRSPLERRGGQVASAA